MLLILVFLKTCQFAPQEKQAVGMNNLHSYISILILYVCHLLFTCRLLISEWNQWCQISLCSQLYSLKFFHFCNAAGVSCKQREHLHSVHYCNLLGSRVLPEAEAEGSPATVQSLEGLSGLVCPRKCRWRDSGSCSGWPGSCRLCLVKF